MHRGFSSRDSRTARKRQNQRAEGKRRNEFPPRRSEKPANDVRQSGGTTLVDRRKTPSPEPSVFNNGVHHPPWFRGDECFPVQRTVARD